MRNVIILDCTYALIPLPRASAVVCGATENSTTLNMNDKNPYNIFIG